MTNKTSIYIVDDHRILRDGLRALLETRPDFRVVGEADDGRAAVDGVLKKKPDLVLMDITMPGLNGIDAAQLIHDQAPETKIIILSVHSDAEHIYRAFQAGAQGYLLKESAGNDVIDAVRDVMAGKQYLSSKITRAEVEDYTRLRQTRSPLEMLSLREKEVLLSTVQGATSAEIAIHLGLSPKTVETYRSRIMTKLSVDDITGLVRFAIKHGLISVD